MVKAPFRLVVGVHEGGWMDGLGNILIIRDDFAADVKLQHCEYWHDFNAFFI